MVLALVGAAARNGARLISRRRRVPCPARDGTFECLITTNVEIARDVEVESCSAFEPPGVVACDKMCLRGGDGQLVTR